jgi:hypothetical protein
VGSFIRPGHGPIDEDKDAAVVPDAFLGYFTAAAAAAGALIGLLFVSISLRPDSVFAGKSAADGRALAGSAFTALVNAFFVALLALLPGTNVGYPAAILAGYSLYRTLQLHWRIGKRDLHLLSLILSFGTYLWQLVAGVLLVTHPHDSSFLYAVAYLLIASFSVALVRAWALLQGRHISRAEPASNRPLSGGA